MTLVDLGVFVVGIANLAGVMLLMKWISALKGTVAAQETALKTLSSLNTTVLEIIKALDPERWAKEVQIHKRLADEKVASLVEAERRRFEESRRTDMTGLASIFEEEFERLYTVMFGFLIQTPKRRRADIINGVAGLRDNMRGRLLKSAEELPDESFEGSMAGGFEALGFAMQRVTQDLAPIRK